jgi:hypothetical protein
MDKRWRNLGIVLLIIIVVISFFLVRVEGGGNQRHTLDSENVQLITQLCEDYNVDPNTLAYFGESSEELSELHSELVGLNQLTDIEQGFRDVVKTRVEFFQKYYELTDSLDEFNIDLDNFKVDCALKNTYLDINYLSVDASEALTLAKEAYSNNINILYVNFEDYEFDSLNSSEIDLAIIDLQTKIDEAVQVCE